MNEHTLTSDGGNAWRVYYRLHDGSKGEQVATCYPRHYTIEQVLDFYPVDTHIVESVSISQRAFA